MCSSVTSDRTTVTTEESTLSGVDTVEETFDRLEPPRFAWCGPERQFVTGGAIKTVTAAGPERFQQLDAAAATLSTEAPPGGDRHTVPFVCGGRFSAAAAQDRRGGRFRPRCSLCRPPSWKPLATGYSW
ncbi:MAG: hypothetical protein J07HX5_00803 [halophilic archaeon J07HX5]|nr:MAG: hypothetical protein J07HX5_00803 [halophilic archaeon J07HX5]